MKLTHIKNVDEFFKVVDSCKGRVELVTGEGDRLNLKSKLSQYIALTQMFKDAQIGEIEIMVSEPEDMSMIIDYLVRG